MLEFLVGSGRRDEETFAVSVNWRSEQFHPTNPEVI